MSVEARASYSTTCTSETDDGDYETSSEGAIRNMQGKQIKGILSRNSMKLDSIYDYDVENPEHEGKESSEESSYNQGTTFAPSTVLAWSKSMPVFKSTSSSTEDNQEEVIAQTSESSLACQKKMEMIVDEIDPHLSSGSNLNMSSNISGMNTTNESYESRKSESNITLSVLQNIVTQETSSSKEVTFYELPENKESDEARESDRVSIRASKDPERPRNAKDVDDLIDIAENSQPFIKSFYFPPIPEKEISCLHSRHQPRITKDTDAIMKIRGELGPYRHKLNEIRNEFWALRSIPPSELSHSYYPYQYTAPPNVSEYYPCRTENFGTDKVSNTTHLMGQYGMGRDYYGNGLSHPANNETASPSKDFFPINESVSRNFYVGNQKSYSLMAHPRFSSKSIGRNLSNVTSDWQVEESDGYASTKHSYVQLENRIYNNPSDSLVLPAGSPYYSCHRSKGFIMHRSHTPTCEDEPDFRGSNITFVKQSGARSISRRPIDRSCQGSFTIKKFDKISQADRPELPIASVSGKLIKSLEASTVASSPKVRVLSVSTSMKEHYTSDKMTEKSTNTTRRSSVVNCNNNLISSRDQNVSASLLVIDSNEGSKARYLNYTSVESQVSSILSEKNPTAMISTLNQNRDESNDQSKKELRDLDVQCSNLDLKETTSMKSIETLLKPGKSGNCSESSAPNKLRSVQLVKTDEKVVIVPILFTDGIPEPSKAPLFHFTRSRCHLPKTNRHLIKLDKRSSTITQNSVYSAQSGESSTMESSYLSQKLMNRNSGLSVSCASRTGSSLHYRNTSHISNTIKTLSDYHSRGRHSHSSKAHSEPTRRVNKKVIHGMRSSPEEFLCDT